jgi:hypothetical protein
MLRVYYALNRNSNLPLNHYLALYPKRNQPDRTIFRQLDENVAVFGCFERLRQKYGSKLPEYILQQVQRGKVCRLIVYLQFIIFRLQITEPSPREKWHLKLISLTLQCMQH